MEHESKREWFKRSTALGKVLFSLGCIKLVSNGASDNKLRFSAYFRRLNPFSWAFFIVGFIVGGINKETIDSLKNDTVWW